MYLTLRGELALEPEAGGVGAAEELVGRQSVVDAEPVGELALGAADAREARDAAAQRDVPVERVAQVAGAHHLRRVALGHVRGPDVQVVAHLRCQEPAGERQEELVELDVLALLDRLGVPEGVGVGRVQALLVQVAHVAEEPHVDLALLALDQQEPGVGDVLGATAPSPPPSPRPRPARGRPRTPRHSRPTPRCPCRRSPRSCPEGRRTAPCERAIATPPDVSAGQCCRSPGFDEHETSGGRAASAAGVPPAACTASGAAAGAAAGVTLSDATSAGSAPAGMPASQSPPINARAMGLINTPCRSGALPASPRRTHQHNFVWPRRMDLAVAVRMPSGTGSLDTRSSGSIATICPRR